MINKSRNLVELSNIDQKNIKVIGGKADGLYKLTNAGFNVPKGFVITTNLFDKNLDNFKKDILSLFDSLSLNKVAVRSSANFEDSDKESFAGQFETYLDVDRSKLLDSIKKCQNSVNSKKVKNYCKFNKIDHSKIKMAVIIQEMIKAESSGVTFTINPLNKSIDEIIINAGLGQGERIVSGKVNTDTYIINKEKMRIIELVSEDEGKQVLAEESIIELSRLCLKIEKLFKYSVDIEWSFSRGTFYFLQARRVTGI